MMSDKRKASLKSELELKTASIKEKFSLEVEERQSSLSLDSSQEADKRKNLTVINLRAIVWITIFLTTLGIGLSVFTSLDTQVKRMVSTTGQLKNQTIAREFQAPLNRVLKEVYVKKGEKVEKGQPLVMFVAQDLYEKLKALEDSRQALMQQNQFYLRSIEDNIPTSEAEGEILRLKLPREAVFLVRSRASLQESMTQAKQQVRDKKAEVDGATQNIASLQENPLTSNAPIATAKLEIQQLKDQLARNQVQLEDTRSRLDMAHKNLAKIKPLVKEGAIARVEYLEAQQTLETQKAELEKLRSEELRLKNTLIRGERRLDSSIALTQQQALGKIATQQQQIDSYQKQFANAQKQIVEIDRQLTEIKVENDKSIAELDKEIRSLKDTANALIMQSPIAGTITELQASPGSIAPPTETKTFLTIVPNASEPIAEILITKEDFPLIREGMKAQIEIEIPTVDLVGKIEGTVAEIGSDVLPPTKAHPFYALPVKISLPASELILNGKSVPIPLGKNAKVTIGIDRKQSGLKTALLSFLRTQQQ